ncbi:uncharacterized protein [Drosophila kikkawai]|uniref:Uncharacterized protein n=1 Tax=Drosophila kikkawai TaxID=30033 RepID=A0A6P4HYD7_DROKI|nr:uncharacterized protein LOC108070870 [Drosophila kikkawai]
MQVKMFSILLIFVLQFVVTPVLGHIQIIQELNLALRTELNVLIDVEDFYSSSILYGLDTPRIQLSSKSREAMNLRLRGNFTSQALIIVQLMEFGLDPKVVDFLPLLLDRLHELHIVFLSKEDPESLQMELYTYCYKEGFINVILIYNDCLYSYLPYPSIQPIRLANVSEYLTRGRTIRNFKGFPVRILQTTLAPRDFEYFDERNRLVRAGYMFTAMKEFTDRYSATIVSVPIPDLPEMEKYAAVLDMVINKEVDLIGYFKDMEWDVSYTEPLSILKSYFIVPHARPLSSYLYYSRPFKWTLWLVVALTVFYGALMLYLGSRRDGKEIGECLLYSLSHILNTCNQAIRTTGWRDQLIHMILTLGGFMLTNLYLATLSSILTSGLSEPQYKTVQDLADAPYPSLHDGLYRRQLMGNEFLPKALRQKSMTLNITLLTAYRDGLNKSYIYLSYEDRLELILMQQYLLKTPRFDLIREPVSYALEAYPVSRSLPFLKLATEFMRRLQEHGINIKIKADAFQVMLERKMYTLMRDDEPPAKAFDLQFYFFAYGLWTVGLGLSLIVFLVEVIKSRLSHKKKQ